MWKVFLLISWPKFLVSSHRAEWPKCSSHLGEDHHSFIPFIPHPWAPTPKKPWRHGNAGAEGTARPSFSAAFRAMTTQRSPTACGRTSPCRRWSPRCPSPVMMSWMPCSLSWWYVLYCIFVLFLLGFCLSCKHVFMCYTEVAESDI